MKSRLLLILIFLLLALLQIGVLQAQGWEKTYEKTGATEKAYAVCTTPDGGYLMVGSSSDSILAHPRWVLVKLNQRGEEQWRRIDQNTTHSHSTLIDMEPTPDGGYIAAGRSRDNGTYAYESYLVKFDNAGNLEWESEFDSLPNGLIATYDVDVTPDNGFILTGYYDGECIVYKKDSVGTTEWRKVYTNFSTTGLDIEVMPNQSGYALLAGVSPSGGTKSYLLYRLDMQGDTLWTRTYLAEQAGDFGLNGALVITADGHFGIGGSYRPTMLSNRDLWIAKLDTTDGTIVWQQFYGRSPNADFGHDIINTLDGGLLATGYANAGSTAKLSLVKVDGSGNTVWQKEYGQWGNQTRGRCILALPDSSYVVCGYTTPPTTPNFNTWDFLYAIKVNDDGELYGSVLSGQVYYDRDSSCAYNGNDLPLANRLVYAYKDSNTVFYGSTDSAGNYNIRIDTGRYRVRLFQNYTHAYYDNHGCVADTILTNIWYSGNNRTVDFPQVATTDCSLIEVNMGTPRLRRCFWNTYTVSYCNYGTQDAINTEMEVVLDSYLTIDTFGLPASTVILPNNTFLFTVDSIGVGTCNSFQFLVYVDCDSTVLGQTHCSQVSITPDTSCVVPPWLGANIQLDATCLGDSINVVLRNVGGSMNTPLNYLVYEDNIMLRTQSFLLNAGQSQNFRFESTGNTYRIEAQQPTGFPILLGDSIVARVIERCNGVGTLGLVTSLPNYDGSPFIDIDCRENIGAYDPNDKRGFPAGVGTPNYITKENKLDYHVRFQNTGTDTAFTVVIIDTISPALDILTLQMGASSHNYTMDVYGENDQIIAFTFNNILLVDSNTNEPLSHGFIQFTIDQKANNSLGTIINNEAAIYFDFNAPIFTNTTLHTIGENFIQVVVISVDELEEQPIAVQVIPNPFRDQAIIQVDGLTPTQPLDLQVYNMMGQEVTNLQSNSHQFVLQRGRLEAGVYVFRVVEGGVLKATGKVIVR